MKIPEDLQEQYKLAVEGADHPISTNTELLLYSAIRSHISTIARLTEQLKVKELEKQNKQQCIDDLKSNLAKLESELTQTKTENDLLNKVQAALWDKFGECPHNHAQPDKDSNGLCACSLDRKEDVCAYHAPQLKRALVELAQAKVEIERLTKWGEGWQKGCIEEQASNARLARGCNALRAENEKLKAGKG